MSERMSPYKAGQQAETDYSLYKDAHEARVAAQQDLETITNTASTSRDKLAEAIDEAGGVPHAPGFFAEEDKVKDWRHRPDKKSHLDRTEEYSVQLGVDKGAVKQYKEHSLAEGDAHARLQDTTSAEAPVISWARSHYQQNREAYQQSALNDAKQAGITVNFDKQ